MITMLKTKSQVCQLSDLTEEKREKRRHMRGGHQTHTNRSCFSSLQIKMITMLKAESRVSRLSFPDVMKKLAEQRPEEPTFISGKLAAVEKYVVVHGQIILQQFREYPDRLIQQSAFGAGLLAQMEARHHTKLLLSKKKLKVGHETEPAGAQSNHSEWSLWRLS
jgi:DNA (cytosine-5)-methyltransferase 1